jgi:hypothetical protein
MCIWISGTSQTYNSTHTQWVVRGRAKGCMLLLAPPDDADHCMAALPWGVVIIDESHNLRTTNSRQADSPHTGKMACLRPAFAAA